MALPSQPDEVRRQRRPRRRSAVASGAVDYRDEFRYLYSGSEKKVEIVHAPKMNYLAIDGTAGDPAGSPWFTQATDLLCRVSLEVRTAVSRAGVMDFALMPLECIWWNDGDGAIERWTLMMMQPVISPALVDVIVDRLRRSDPPLARPLDQVRLVRFYEGVAAQTLTRSGRMCCPAAVDRIARYADENGYHRHGALHEVFLDGIAVSPTRRSQRLLRQPVRPVVPPPIG